MLSFPAADKYRIYVVSGELVAQARGEGWELGCAGWGGGEGGGPGGGGGGGVEVGGRAPRDVQPILRTRRTKEKCISPRPHLHASPIWCSHALFFYACPVTRDDAPTNPSRYSAAGSVDAAPIRFGSDRRRYGRRPTSPATATCRRARFWYGT